MTSIVKPPYREIEWDDQLEQTSEARLALAVGQARVERWINERAQVRPLDVSVLLGFHRTMFEDVWPDFAGRLRGPDPGQIPINVTFGNYRGEQYKDVPFYVDKLFDRVPAYLKQLDDMQLQPDAEFFKSQVCQVASYIHCRLIDIHPFANGNGRTARLCVNYFAVRYGFLPISIERPKGDYLDAIRTYLQRKIPDHFADFLIECMQRETS